MASELQVARGSLRAKGPENLLRGELFWVPSNASDNSESTYRKDPRFPYDTGTLYIGRPSLTNKDGDLEDVYENPIPIAGERAYKGMVFRGFISTEQNITDERFKFVREGDFFIFHNDAAGGVFKNEYGFVTGDILLITHADYDIAPDLTKNEVGESKNVEFIRFNGSGGEAKYTKYKNDEHPGVESVKDALDDIYIKKLEYKGRIPEDHTYDSLMTSNGELTAGSLYHVTIDGLSFTGKNSNGAQETWVSQKGDFVIWQNDDDGWILVPSGYTDADQIDFDPSRAVEEQNIIGTFTEDLSEHINSTRNLNNVQEALTYLLSHKAMLDSNGKVPLSQLHSTVLGGMQYMGTWDPITDAKGVNDPTYQREWPTGRTSNEIDGDEESSGSGNAANNGNKPGDYYIVKVSNGLKNIQYQDKTSTPIGSGYSRTLELNSGDFIVYQVDPKDQTASWEVIDNSDSITALNFVINGTHTNGKTEYADTSEEISIVGNPTMAATDKLVLWQQENRINVAGVNLVDNVVEDAGVTQHNYLPVYVNNTNTLKRSTIENYITSANEKITQTNSNLYVGNAKESHNAYVFGDIYLRPKLIPVDGVQKQTNTGIKFQTTTVQGGTNYNSASLMPDANQGNGITITLPDDNSKLIGKLSGVDLMRNRLVKVSNRADNTGYIDNTSIEEHMHNSVTTEMYMDKEVASVEFHAPVIDVNNIELRKLIFGQSKNLDKNLTNGGAFSDDGRLLENEKTSEIISHTEQSDSVVVNKLPLGSGILINDQDLKRSIKGEEGTLPIYGKPEQLAGEDRPRCTLIDSKIKQVSNSLFESLFHTASRTKTTTRTMGSDCKVNDSKYYSYSEHDYIKEVYGDYTVDENGNKTYLDKGTPDNVTITTDTIIGETSIGDDNQSYVSTPRSLMVTKSLILGNKDTNNTHVIPGRTLFPGSAQYRYAKNEHPLPIADVYVEMPAVSGVLLTDNSRIDGGFFLD